MELNDADSPSSYASIDASAAYAGAVVSLVASKRDCLLEGSCGRHCVSVLPACTRRSSKGTSTHQMWGEEILGSEHNKDLGLI